MSDSPAAPDGGQKAAMEADDLPICGDPECGNPTCKRSALDRFFDEVERNTQELLAALCRQEASGDE